MTDSPLQQSEFIQKLSKIVESNLADENFGVKELAKAMGISRSNLYFKVNSITKKSVSRFICETRLKKGMELLKQNSLTVSEVAFKVGFGSPSYFIKCFRDHYGYPPGAFLKIKTENLTEGSNNNEEQTDEKVTDGLLPNRKKRINVFLKIFAGLVGILTIIFIASFVYRNIILHTHLDNKNQIVKEKSIAVLPLKNLNENTLNQHLADGIMEDILNRLSHLQGLKVKSRISSEQFRNPEMSLPEIAKEMDVSYVLEGSLMNNGNKVRIYVQLIDAENDNHIWSDQYNQDLTDIFEFISSVSKNVADELQVVLSPNERKNIEKNYTKDKEAYNLYLIGRYFCYRTTWDDMLTSINYYRKAIEMDTTYSLAYAGLADAYNTLTHNGYFPFDEGVQKCKDYALKAIRFDPNLAEAHASLGDCASDFLWDWELAGKELKLALKLNPNYALAHKFYGDYLNILGKNDEARIHLNKAIDLNPQAYWMYDSSVKLYYNVGDFEGVISDLEKRSQFYKYPRSEHFYKFKINLFRGKEEEAFDELKQWIPFGTDTIDYTETLNQIFAESGIKGVIRWNADYFFKIYKPEDNYGLAALFAYLGAKDSAINYLEKEFNSNSRIRYRLSGIKNYYDFRSLHDYPRFEALLEKMNLTDK